jgi:DNA-binding transcriptional LysR family regulator
MNIHLLKSFVTLARSLHYGAASQALHMSQPALTKQIKRLEEDLGGTLFRRSRHGTELTELGRLFLDESGPLLQRVEELYRRGRRAARGELGRLDIGFSFSTVDVVSGVLPQFRQRYPDVETGLHDLSSLAQMEQLLEGRLHVGFVRLPAHEGLSQRRILSDRLALVMPRAMAADIRRFDIDAIRHLPFIQLQRARAPGLFDHIAHFFALHDFQPRVVQHASESLTILSLVGAGIGVSVMHESALRSRSDSVAYVPIEDPRARWDVGIAWRGAQPDPVVEAFVQIVSAASAPAAAFQPPQSSEISTTTGA